jgi:PTH2 family peptidyl-tRNA hydrolase
MIYKQVILVRQDLKLPKGKMAAQVAHASVECVQKSDKKIVEAWRDSGMPKVVLKVADEKELLEFQKRCGQAKIITALITDAGHTVVEPGTKTCLGIGPDLADKIDKITGSLKLMN